VSLGYSPDGKRRRRTVRGRTKTEIRDKLRDLREDIASGVQSPATYSVQQVIEDWLRDGLDGRSAATVSKYRHVLKPVLERHSNHRLLPNRSLSCEQPGRGPPSAGTHEAGTDA
jgi:hypothetical protein